MSRIKGKNTKPEILVRKFLFKNGYRYRLHQRNLPGKPDIVLKKFNTVIFVHGCFWHRHEGCPKCTSPKSNVDFWAKKFGETKERDRSHQEQLVKAKWNVVVIWECQLHSSNIEETFEKLLAKLKYGNPHN